MITVDEDGNEFWKDCHTRFHRTDGPAIIWNDYHMSWHVDGRRYRDNKSFQVAANLSDEDMLAMILTYGNVS
jgi:hypothetical protein